MQAGHAPGPSTSGDMQASASLEGWDSGDMEDFQEASSEVDGIPPTLHLLADPTIPINIPETQVHHPASKGTTLRITEFLSRSKNWADAHVITKSHVCRCHQASMPCHGCAVHDAASLPSLCSEHEPCMLTLWFEQKHFCDHVLVIISGI